MIIKANNRAIKKYFDVMVSDVSDYIVFGNKHIKH
jgi:hypothetical protein